MEITIRPTVITDFERLIKVETAATPGLSYLPNVFGTFLNDTSGAFLTAEFDGEIVGCGKFSVMPDGSAWLETLRVLPEYQGKGIGKRFYEYFLNLASEKNISYLRMYTGIKNVVSKGLAERFGFELVGTFKTASCPVLPYLFPDMPNSMQLIHDLTRATEIIHSSSKRFAGLIGLNRTFFKLSDPSIQGLINNKWLYASSDGKNFIILASRFMPEKALYILDYHGDISTLLGFAMQKAIDIGTHKLTCHFPAESTQIFGELVENGMQIEPGEIIVMERHLV